MVVFYGDERNNILDILFTNHIPPATEARLRARLLELNGQLETETDAKRIAKIQHGILMVERELGVQNKPPWM